MSRPIEEIKARIEELRSLEAGWLDFDKAGQPIDAEVLRFAESLLTARVRIYPTEESGVCLEWEDDTTMWHLEVEPGLIASILGVERRR